jgi:NDP-sugar pyrophosphorylase family protein
MTAAPAEAGSCGLEALVLCGGMGTRLQSVLGERPKALAEVGERPFLAILLEAFARQGIRRFVLCTGYRSEAIEASVPELARFGRIVLSREPEPLGTGGAVKQALGRVEGERVLVCNGDSICPFSVVDLVTCHERSGALLTLAAVLDPERGDAGCLRVAPGGRVESFREKEARIGGGFVSAGVYVMERAAFAHPAASSDRFSLELDMIPALVGAGRVFACPTAGPLLDIGTPSRLSAARSVLDRMGLSSA